MASLLDHLLLYRCLNCRACPVCFLTLFYSPKKTVSVFFFGRTVMWEPFQIWPFVMNPLTVRPYLTLSMFNLQGSSAVLSYSVLCKKKPPLCQAARPCPSLAYQSPSLWGGALSVLTVRLSPRARLLLVFYILPVPLVLRKEENNIPLPAQLLLLTTPQSRTLLTMVPGCQRRIGSTTWRRSPPWHSTGARHGPRCLPLAYAHAIDTR
jgi:hypothetical protein